MRRNSFVPFEELRTGRLSRRAILGAFGAFTLAGCGGGSDSTASSTAAAGTASGASGTTSGTASGTAGTGSTPSCVLIPEETVGPYPLFNSIAAAAVYQRQDITEGKTGIPLRLLLTIVNVNNACAAVTNAMVYVWHCDKDGAYSGYNQQGASTVGQTFCRGVQATDSAGAVVFDTIYPGWYTGRITHIHFRVYLGNDLAATSQLAFPQSVTQAVYSTADYAARGQNTSVSGFSGDNVFADGVTYQLATVTANATTGGYDAALTVGIAM